MNRLRELRKSKGMTMKEVGYHFNVSESTISNYESGKREPEYALLARLADFYDTTTDYILGLTDITSEAQLSIIPVAGKIACGSPIEAIDTYDEYIQVPHGTKADMALLCVGDSMEPYIKSGDYVLIRRQPDVEEGQVAAVKIDGEATLKRVYHISGGLLLVAENHSYAPIKAQYTDIQIIGLAVGLHRSLV